MDIATIAPSGVLAGDAVLDVRHHVGSAQLRESRVVLHVDRDGDAEAIAQRLRDLGAHEIVALRASLDDCRSAGLTLEEPTLD